jgi:flagellar biosynthetic protein FliR
MVTLLFVTNGHLLLIRGFMASFDAVGFHGPPLADLTDLFVRDLGMFLVAAIEIAAPLLAALFLSEVALGILARAAPQMNVFILGFPLKILLTLVLGGLALPLLPGAMEALGGRALDHMGAVFSALTG